MPPKKTSPTVSGKEALATEDLTTISGLKAVLRGGSFAVNTKIDPSHVEENPTFFLREEGTLLENLMYADRDVSEATAFLLSRKASTRIGDPLAHAAYNGQVGAIAALLEAKALVNGNGGKQSKGMIPLLAAAKSPSKPLQSVLALLKDDKLVLGKKLPKTKDSVFHVLAKARMKDTELDSADDRVVAAGAVGKEIERRIADGIKITNFINSKNLAGDTALMLAAKTGDASFVRKLLLYGASRTAKNAKGQTAVDLFYGDEEDKEEAFKRVSKGRKSLVARNSPGAAKSKAQQKREDDYAELFGADIPDGMTIAEVNAAIKSGRAEKKASPKSKKPKGSPRATADTPEDEKSDAQKKREKEYSELFEGDYPYDRLAAEVAKMIREQKAKNKAKRIGATPKKPAASPKKTAASPKKPSKAARVKAAKAAKAAAK